MVSLKHEFGDAFSALCSQAVSPATLVTLDIGRRHFPTFLGDRNINTTEVKVFVLRNDKMIMNEGGYVLHSFPNAMALQV